MEQRGGLGKVRVVNQSVELPVFAEEGESVRDDDGGSEVVQEVRAGECSAVGDTLCVNKAKF